MGGEVPTEDSSDPWVPLESIEEICGSCVREMMSRNIKAVRLSVLTESGLVEQGEGIDPEVDVPRANEWIQSTPEFRAFDPELQGKLLQHLTLDQEGEWGEPEPPYTEEEAVELYPLTGELMSKAYAMKDQGKYGDDGLYAVFELMKYEIGENHFEELEQRGLTRGVEEKTTKDGWPKKLKTGRFTEWCKRNGFPGGPSIACVKKAMQSDDASVRGQASFYANTIKPEGKDLGDIMEQASSFRAAHKAAKKAWARAEEVETEEAWKEAASLMNRAGDLAWEEIKKGKTGRSGDEED